jgi:Fe-S-cluster containining protein
MDIRERLQEIENQCDPLSIEEKQKLCLQCLKCCEYIGVLAAFSSNNTRMIDFYKTRACEVIIDEGELPIIVIPHRCQHLTANGCAIYENRPLDCKLMDGRTCRVVKKYCLWVEENRMKFEGRL